MKSEETDSEEGTEGGTYNRCRLERLTLKHTHPIDETRSRETNIPCQINIPDNEIRDEENH